jgi:hypothetical protein
MQKIYYGGILENISVRDEERKLGKKLTHDVIATEASANEAF